MNLALRFLNIFTDKGHGVYFHISLFIIAYMPRHSRILHETIVMYFQYCILISMFYISILFSHISVITTMPGYLLVQVIPPCVHALLRYHLCCLVRKDRIWPSDSFEFLLSYEFSYCEHLNWSVCTYQFSNGKKYIFIKYINTDILLTNYDQYTLGIYVFKSCKLF